MSEKSETPNSDHLRRETHAGACHCGTVTFTAVLPEGLSSARRCSCTFCRMRGAVAVTALLDGFTLHSGADNLALYTFNTGTAQHYFCKTCGIYTHHRRRSNPNEYGVNAACLTGVSPFDFANVIVHNGRVHPADDPTAPSVDGVLTYTPNA